ncbi:MAG: hypothetical protein ACTSXD_03810, partial [Candidatus Heimdallarchaeaceae archaeon]
QQPTPRTIGQKTLSGLGKTLDVLNTGAYAVGGILSGKSAGEGIKEKILPSVAFGIKNKFAAFVVDVALDPTTYMSFGTTGAAKVALKGGAKVGGRIAGKALSKNGAKLLAKEVEKDVLKMGTKKMSNEMVDELVQKAKLRVAVQIDKDLKRKGVSKLLEKSSIRVGLPFSGKEFKLAEYTVPKVVKKAVSPLGIPFKKLAPIFSTTAKIKQTHKGLAKTEAALQFAQKTKTLQGSIKGTVASKIIPILKESDEASFDGARKYIEASKNAPSIQIINESISKLRANKDLSAEAIKKIETVIKKIVPINKKIEKELIEKGFLKGTTEMGYFPRAKDLEDLAKPVVTGGGGVKASKFHGRKVGELVGEDRKLVKIKDRGKKAVVIEKDAARETLRYISKKKVGEVTTKFIKTTGKKRKALEKEYKKIRKATAKTIKRTESKKAKLYHQKKLVERLRKFPKKAFIKKRVTSLEKVKKMKVVTTTTKKIIKEIKATKGDIKKISKLKEEIKDSKKIAKEFYDGYLKGIKEKYGTPDMTNEEVFLALGKRAGVNAQKDLDIYHDLLKTIDDAVDEIADISKKARPAGEEIIRKTKLVDTGETKLVSKKILKDISKTEKQLKKEIKTLEKKSPEKAEKLQKELDKLIEQKLDLSKQQRELLKQQILKGVPEKELSKTVKQLKNRQDTILKNIDKLSTIKKEGLEKIAKRYGEGDIFIDKGGKKYKLKEATVEEIEKRTDIKFDKALPTLVRNLVKNENAIIAHNIVKDVIDNQGNLAGLGVQKIGAKGKLEGFADLGELTKLPIAKGYQIPEKSAELFKGYFKIVSEEDELSKAMKMYDTVQSWWKSQALLGISYHTRNIVSNSFNMWLAGVKNPITATADTATYWKSLRKGKLTTEESKLIKSFYESGAGQGDFYSAELTEDILDKIRGRNWNIFSSKSKLVGISQDIGSALENGQKFALFRDRLRKGDTITEAASTVKKFLFDYTDLTKVEQKGFKRIIPFYSWSRKNIPLQFEQLIKRPGKAATTQKIQTLIEPENADEIRQDLPNWIKEGHPVILPFQGKNGEAMVVNAEGLLPIYDLTNLRGMSFKNILDMVTPIIKFPLEIASNADTFKNFAQINKSKQPMQHLFADLIDPPIIGGQPRSKFFGGMFNDAQARTITTASRPLRDLDNFFQLGLSKTEKDTYLSRASKIFLTKVHPIDIIEQRSWNKYFDQQLKTEYLDYYKKTTKRYLKNENNIDQRNIDRAEKALFELGFTQEEIIDSQTQALRETLKYDRLGEIINKAIREGRKPTPSETAEIQRELAKTYAGTASQQRKKAKKAIDKLIEQKLESTNKIKYN